MKYILSVLFLFFFFSGFTQIYQEMPQYGYRANRMAFDSTLQIPTVCGVPTLKSVVSVNKKAAVAFDSCNNKFYTYNPKTLTWSEVSGGGATPPLQDVITAGNEYTDGFGNTVRFYEYESVAGVDRFYPLRFFDNDESLPSVDLAEDMYLSTQSSEFKMGNFGNFEPTNFTLNTSGLNIKNAYGGPTNEVNLNYDGLKIYKNESEYTNLNFLNSNNNNENYDVHLPIQNGSANDTLNTLQRFRSDTTNKWVNDVLKKNDSTITIYKGATATDITLTPSTTVASATRLTTIVYNNSGATITKGSVIYINGRHSSNLPTIALAKADSEDSSYATFALVQDDILNNNSGTIIQAGNISNLNLPIASFADGQVVYLSPTVAGGLTVDKTSVLAPNHIIKIGTITRAHPTFGSIEIRIENGWQMDELSDVQIPLYPNDSTLLQYSRVDSLWHSVGITNAIGSNYIKPSDTATMLTKYLRKTDTASLSSRIDLRVKYTDTATMLTPYLRKIDTASLSSRINLKVNISDTATMLTPYIRLAGTGLTKSSQTLSNNLSTGVAGGQSVVGGTAASNSLTLSSTSNATKGKLLFGTSAYDEVNNRLGIGLTSPTTQLDVVGTGKISTTDNSYNQQLVIENKSTGTTALTGIVLQYGSSSSLVGQMTYVPSNYITASLQNTLLFSSAGQQKLAFVANGSGSGSVAQDIYFSTLGTNSTYQMQIKGNTGNIQIGTNTDAGYKLDVNGTARVQGAVNYNPTNTPAGTTGNQTINKPSGTVNIAAAGTTVTVTNNLVTTSSIVFAVIRTNDATATIKNVVPASGSFTINLNSATTAETSIGFRVIN